MTIDVGKDFYHRLANRNKLQGDGQNTAVEFREKYLAELDNEEAWREEREPIVFSFRAVKKIGPSFANEAFAYFTKYVKPGEFLQVVRFQDISPVQMMIIREELDSGYSGK